MHPISATKNKVATEMGRQTHLNKSKVTFDLREGSAFAQCRRAAVNAKSEFRQAQMAESVDALVSNTSGAIRAGSTPALGTQDRLTHVEWSF